MEQYLFFLGRKSELSLLELECVLRRLGHAGTFTEIVPNVVLTFCEKLDAQSLMKMIGGTVKIAKVCATSTDTSTTYISDELEKLLVAENKKVVFSVTEYGKEQLFRDDLMELKRHLKEQKISSRYIETKKAGLSAAQLLHHEITDIHVVYGKDEIYIATTSAIQDIDDWSRRDMQKPYRDTKKGMLPPKLARMLVNIGLGEKQSAGQWLLDPFCGTGTVLMEAAMLGAASIGSDVSSDTILNAQKNMEWLGVTYGVQAVKPVLIVRDATQITVKDLGQQVDCIVTEPFLGKPSPTATQITDIIRGLEKLYIGVLKQWKSLLVRNGRVVLVIPEYHVSGNIFTLSRVIDRLTDLGYTRENGPLLYDRPDAIVKRAIYILATRN